jgi:hypothetical protein
VQAPLGQLNYSKTYETTAGPSVKLSGRFIFAYKYSIKMIKLLTTVLVFALLIFASCSNDQGTALKEKTLADSLMEQVMDGHNIAMAKMGKLTRLEQQTRHLIDSIEKLPAKAQEAAAPYKTKLDSLQKDLSYAEFAMNKWMNEFSMDTLSSDVEQKVKYLESEKGKVNKVKDAILGSIQKADSIINY